MRRAGKFWPLMGVLLLAGLGLRLYHLSPEEFVEGDDATYFLTARSLVVVLDWGWDNLGDLVAGSADPRGLQALLDAQGVELRFPYYSKPFYDFLNVAAIELLGPVPDSLLWMNVFFGGVALVMMGMIGRFLYSETTGLLAAALLAVSGSALIFSRSGMAHMASIALCLTGAVCYCRNWQVSGAGNSYLFSAGIFGGLALATHPNLLPFVGVLLAFEGIYSFRRGSLSAAIRRLGLIGGGIVAVLVSIGLLYLGVERLLSGVLAALPPSPAPFMTYLGQLSAHTQAVIDGDVSLREKLYTYILVFWAHEGGPVLLLILGGTLAGLASRRRGDARLQVLLVVFWVPMVFFIFSRNQAVYRYAAGLVVPALLIAAWSLVQGSTWLTQRRGLAPHWLVWGVGLVLVSYNLWQISPVYNTHSAWAAGGRWLQEHGAGEVMSSAGSQLWSLSRIAAVKPEAGTLPRQRYWALYRRYIKEDEQPLLQAVEERNLAPVYRSEHRRPTKQLELQFIGGSPLLRSLELLPWLGGEISAMRAEVLRRNQLCVLEIYDLDQVDLGMGVSRLSEQGKERPWIVARSAGYAEPF